MRISDWSSDVCSSDLLATVEHAASNGVPIGSVVDFAGTTAPTGYLLCYGQAIGRSEYSDLFDAIGTVWGIGDGATTFNLPDLRGRVGAGKDDLGGTAAGRLSGIVDGETLGASEIGRASGRERVCQYL